MGITIRYLADHPQAISTLAGWLYDEWGHRSPDGTIRGMAQGLHRRLNRDRLPLALVAIDGGIPLGTVSLRPREVEVRPEYEHWLSTLYVDRRYRGRGVGERLVRAAVDQADRLGIEKLYLYTRQEKTEQWYAHLGWQKVEKLNYRDRPAVILGCSI